MTRMVRLPDIPGKTGSLAFSQHLPLPYTAKTDYELKFYPNKEYKFLAAIFVDEDAKSGPGPWWYGVAVRADPWPDQPQVKESAGSAALRIATRFSAGELMPFALNTAVIFFHPTANQGGYQDKNYSSGPHGPWINLFEKYIVMTGLQVAAIPVSPILIMPVIPNSGLGAFPKDWQKIVSQIVSSFKHLRDPITTEGPATIRYLVLSSFSSGIIYMNNFLKSGAGVQGMTRVVIDLDGHCSDAGLSFGLASDKYKTFAYDQAQVTPKGPFFHPFGRGYRMHVPGVRWGRNEKPYPCNNATHGDIPIFMLYDGLVLASLGYSP
jgi:hypothetical protein